MKSVRLARHAMATRFEFVLRGRDVVQLRSAGEEALAEITRLDGRLSFYNSTSELCRINGSAAEGPVSILPDVFDLLTTARNMWELSGGTFDPTIAPLMRCWGFAGGSGQLPKDDRLERARQVTGMSHVLFDPEAKTVRFTRKGVHLDLGGIAKGHALDEAARILLDCGVENALLHGGTSSIIALGTSFDGLPWKVGILMEGQQSIGTVELQNSSLSVSAVSGKAFTIEDTVYGHVIDPRTGFPTKGAQLAAVVAKTAAHADALSTAALVLATESDRLADSCLGWGIQVDKDPFVNFGLPGFKSVSTF